MNAFFLLYALTISVELILTLVMFVFLYLIVAPVGGGTSEQAASPAPPARPADTVERALTEAFTTVSQGRDDLLAITNARAMLVRFAGNDAERDAHAS